MMHGFRFLLIAAMLTLGVQSIAVADDASLEQVLIESATTPAQHAALARYYRGKAAEAKAQAAQHRSMGKAYGGGKMVEVEAMKQHCAKLAELYDAQAVEFESMASSHDAQAKK